LLGLVKPKTDLKRRVKWQNINFMALRAIVAVIRSRISWKFIAEFHVMKQNLWKSNKIIDLNAKKMFRSSQPDLWKHAVKIWP